MNATIRMAAAIGSVAVVAAGLALSLTPARPHQPIPFNHRLHVEDLGSDCTDCHLYAESGVRATIPNLEVCADCHEETQGSSPQEARLVEYISTPERIPWQKIYWVPDHVFFSHRRHTALGGIECATCHGAVGLAEQPATRPFVRLTMAWCMDCHETAEVSNDCLLCHR